MKNFQDRRSKKLICLASYNLKYKTAMYILLEHNSEKNKRERRYRLAGLLSRLR